MTFPDLDKNIWNFKSISFSSIFRLCHEITVFPEIVNYILNSFSFMLILFNFLKSSCAPEISWFYTKHTS